MIAAEPGDADVATGLSGVTENGGAYLPICQPCIDGRGDECHTPGCALWMRDVPPNGLIGEFALSLTDTADHQAALRAVEALAELVALKDGPRDAAYERRKPRAWEAARAALDTAAPTESEAP